MLKQIDVTYLPELDQLTRIDQRLSRLQTLAPYAIDELNWAAYTYRPTVSFKIAYAPSGITLLYTVFEEQVRAVYRQTNDPVYKDSCVEFFFSFDRVRYYNFEFNALGTVLAAYGTERERTYLSEERLKQLEAVPVLASGTQWQLLVYIPFALLEEEPLPAGGIKGCTCFANFYKCGDDLPQPHYLSWNVISYSKPNFHLPRFFGEITFC